VFNVSGAPLEIRWSLKEGDNWAVNAIALTSKIWLVEQALACDATSTRLCECGPKLSRLRSGG
jgi:hypothetical protein